MTKYKPYVEIECADLGVISDKIYDFVNTKTQLLQDGATGWQFLDSKQLMTHVPELFKFFISHKLALRDSAVVILTETGQLPLHMDPMPVIAKINLPVANTKGWTNYWYDMSDEQYAQLPTYTTQFGHTTELLKDVNPADLELVAEIHDLNKVIAFNSRLPHTVVKREDTNLPRIIASFTFKNEPLHLLEYK